MRGEPFREWQPVNMSQEIALTMRNSVVRQTVILTSLSVLLIPPMLAQSVAAAPAGKPAPVVSQTAAENYLRMPLAFERQAGRGEQFVARGEGYAIAVGAGK